MATILTDSSYYADIAAAIRVKNGTTDTYKPSEMAEAILALTITDEPTEESWVGWTNATWSDIYNLCKAKQNGDITEWPADVALGKSKSLTLSTSVLGSSSFTMRIAGIDVDGNGVLTFVASNKSSQKTLFSDTSAAWNTSTVRALCQNIYNFCNAKDYIKPLLKGTNTTYNKSSIAYTEETIWIPSIHELNLYDANYGPVAAEYTKGVSTSYSIPYYYVPSGQFWTRSRSIKSDSTLVIVYDNDITYDGYGPTTETDQGNYLVPAFAIG